MGDSGRREEYDGPRRLWRIESGGEVYWVCAERPSGALLEIEAVTDERMEDVTVRMMGPRESIKSEYPEESDIEDAVRNWPREECAYGFAISAYACEWAEAVPNLMLSTAWAL